MGLSDNFYRLKRLPPYVFAQVQSLKLEARHQGEDIIDFGMGNPDQPTPTHIVEKMIEAARKGKNHRYSASRGITKLRHAIAAWYQRNYDVDLDPGNGSDRDDRIQRRSRPSVAGDDRSGGRRADARHRPIPSTCTAL